MWTRKKAALEDEIRGNGTSVGCQCCGASLAHGGRTASRRVKGRTRKRAHGRAAAERELAALRRENRAVAWLALMIVLVAVAAAFIADPDLAARFFNGFSFPSADDPDTEGLPPPAAAAAAAAAAAQESAAVADHARAHSDWMLD